MGKFVIENAIALTITRHAWGNRKAADKDKIQTRADKNMLNLTKKLIDSPEYQEVTSHLDATKRQLQKWSMPFAGMNSVLLFKIDMVREVEEYLATRAEELKPLVLALVDALPGQMEAAKESLGEEQFNAVDYPTGEELKRSFGISKRWVSYGVPTELPEDVYEQEKQRAKKEWDDAAEAVTMGIRAAAREVFEYLIEKLSPSADGKRKILPDAGLDKIDEFFTLFRKRNLTNDDELERLIEQAEAVLSNSFYGIKDLRKDQDERKYVLQAATQLKATLDGMIIDAPVRKFSLFDEE